MSLTRSLLTFQDLIDHLTFFANANPSAEYTRAARRAILSAMDEIGHIHRWSYYTKHGRVTLNGSFDDGTITYDHTGNAAGERLLILVGGSWPEWAAYGVVVIDTVMYEVATRVSDSAVQLSISSNPGEDITTDTDYTLFRDTYPLPGDLISIDQLYTPESWRRIDFIHPREWLVAHRYNVTSANTPMMFTVTGDPNYMGTLAARFYPFPDSDLTVDFIYHGRPRPLNIEKYSDGTVTTSADSTTVSGVDTTFTDDMIGSVLRVSKDSDDYPTGLDGLNPFKEERIVMSRTNATTIVVDRAFNNSLSGVKYLISDPVDIEYGAMTTALLRMCEYQLGVIRRLERLQELGAISNAAVNQAREADSRSSALRSVSVDGHFGRRLAYMPAGADDE